MENHGYTVTAYCGVDIPIENVTSKNDVPKLLRKVMINYCKNNEEKNPLKDGTNLYITKSFNENIPYRAIIVENTSIMKIS